LVDSIYYTGNDDVRRRLAYAKEIGSFQYDKGADVAAANDLTVGQDGNLYTITGATTINAINTGQWQAGAQIAFIFTGAPLVKNNTAGGAGTATMLLAGRTDFQAAAGDYLELQYDGTNWYETNRAVAATVGSNTYSELLTQSGNSVTWGGTATTDRTATLGANTVLFTANSLAGDPAISITSTSTAAASGAQKGLNVDLSGANANNNEVSVAGYFSNTHTGTNAQNRAVQGITSGASSITAYFTSTNGVALFAQSSGGTYGAEIQSTTGIGAYIHSDNGGVALNTQSIGATSAQINALYTSTNSVITVAELLRATTGTAADGIGGSLDFYSEGDNGTSYLTNQFISKLTTAANATRVSQAIITGVDAAVTGNIISFEGNKRTMLYGRLEMQQGADVASAAGAIAVGLDGNVFEITGTAAITLISNLNFVNGSVIHLVFTSTASVASGTATSGTDISILLAGGATFNASANDVLTLLLSEVGGTQTWKEVSRSVN